MISNVEAKEIQALERERIVKFMLKLAENYDKYDGLKMHAGVARSLAYMVQNNMHWFLRGNTFLRDHS